MQAHGSCIAFVRWRFCLRFRLPIRLFFSLRQGFQLMKVFSVVPKFDLGTFLLDAAVVSAGIRDLDIFITNKLRLIAGKERA